MVIPTYIVLFPVAYCRESAKAAEENVTFRVRVCTLRNVYNCHTIIVVKYEIFMEFMGKYMSNIKI